MNNAAYYRGRFKAGLILCGQGLDGELEWMGSLGQFQEASRYQEWLEDYGRLPRDDFPYREREPGQWTK